MLPMAVPGLVLGLGYVFFFNAPWNPLNVLYGTLTVLVINTIAHFYTVAHITAMTALKQIDAEFEAVSASLKVPFWRTFGRVTVPICMPAILDIAVYMFVNALTTVSAVIFLYGAGTKLASIAIVHMDESGTIAAAAAMATRHHGDRDRRQGRAPRAQPAGVRAAAGVAEAVGSIGAAFPPRRRRRACPGDPDPRALSPRNRNGRDKPGHDRRKSSPRRVFGGRQQEDHERTPCSFGLTGTIRRRSASAPGASPSCRRR